jgi:hypothetical protein
VPSSRRLPARWFGFGFITRSDRKPVRNPTAQSNADTQETGDKQGHPPPVLFSSPNACRIAGSESHEPHRSQHRLRYRPLRAKARTSAPQLLYRRKIPATRAPVPTKGLSEMVLRATCLYQSPTTKTTEERRSRLSKFQIDAIAAHSVRRLVRMSSCAARFSLSSPRNYKLLSRVRR